LSGWRQHALWIVPLLAAGVYLYLSTNGASTAMAATVALTLLCAGWWIAEPVPIAFTSLIPIAALPLLGVLTPRQVAEAYGNDLVLLLMGGFMLSKALEAQGAHRRMAYGMVRAFGGGSGRNLLFGFMAATGLISMWISNTATTLMMLPVALAVLERYPDPRLSAPLVLGIAYAASIGGMGTPIGTPPNLVFMRTYEQTTGQAYGFLDWMMIGVPVVALLLPLCALWLGRGLRATPAAPLPALGPWSAGERRVLLLFVFTALAWMTRGEPFGGWAGALGLPLANDASVALLAVVLMGVIGDGSGGRLLHWEHASTIPWGALLLFGGGIALASAFEQSGLSDAIAQTLSGLRGIPMLPLLLLICGGIVLLSEIASNTAAAVLLMPILAAAAIAMDVEPALLMFPAVLAASCGFMLPVATAANAIAYGSGHADSRRMLREGATIDLLGVIVIVIACWLLLG
jgi:sodium-dependent dicarboxylate transporter 2/3/5